MQTEVKFRLAGGAQPLILVPAFVNKKGPFEFILDTGAGTSLLSTELAQRLGIDEGESKEARGAGGKVQVILSQVKSLVIGAAILEDIQIAITDLTGVGSALGTKIEGDIGYNFLKTFRVTIDYQTQVLRLTQGEESSQSPNMQKVKFKLASPAKPLILVSTYVNSQGPFQFAVDTGASTTVISPEVAQELRIESVAISPMTAGGGNVKASAGRVASLAVGTATHEDVAVVVSDFLVSLSGIVGAQLDGIVGYNYLKNFTVTIDYPRDTLGLQSA